MNTRKLRVPLVLSLAAFACALASVSAQADEDDYYSSDRKTVSCNSNDGHKKECAADLHGYVVRDVDQSSRTECVVGRNWGYDDRGVWVDDGCRANFIFDRGRGGDHPRSYGFREEGNSRAEEVRVRCESRDGRRANCDADLRGYRIADVREVSRTDCDIGRNFGYDDRGVWVDQGCRGEFIFARARGGRVSDGRDLDDRRSER